MTMGTTMNRRELIKISGGIAAGIAAASASPSVVAQVPMANELINLSGNENPYGPSPAVLEVLNQSTAIANRYSYDIQKELVKDIARKEGVNPEQIVFCSGSTEAIYSTMMAYMSHGGEAVTAELTHGLVFQFARATGGTVTKVPLNSDLEYDLDALHARVTPDKKLVYFCNPNNPTGTLIDGDNLRDFCTSLPKDTIALIDEAYLEYTDDFPRSSMVDLVRAGHNVVVTRTFSKIHGLAGLRVGYAIASPEAAERIAMYKVCRFQGPLGVVAAQVSLNDAEWQNFCRAKNKEGREVVYKLCEDLGLDYVRASGNFVFFDPKMPYASYNERLLAQGILGARQFPIKDDWARITIGTTEEMAVFAKALLAVIGI
jgi:histidinol-phosphate aminotransferase